MSTMYVDARPSDAINIAKRCKVCFCAPMKTLAGS